jgi:hypothetical protein
MKKYFIFLILFISKASAQITFEKTFAGIDDQIGYSVCQNYDGGYIITGQNLKLPFYRNLLLIRTDSLGDTMWTKIFEADSIAQMGLTVSQTIDSGFVVCGRSFDPNLPSSIFLLKTDQNGNIVWLKRFGSQTKNVIGGSMKETPDSGFIMCGSYESTNGNYQVLVVKTNSVGDTLWTRIYLYPSSFATSIDLTQDNGYIISGESVGTPLIMKLDANGNIIFLKQYTISGIETRIHSTSDGGYILCGTIFHADGDALLLKLDSIGNVLWAKSFDGPLSYDDWGETVIETKDSSYVCIVEGGSYIVPVISIIKTDKSGNLLWSKINDGINESGCHFDAAISQTSDAGFISSGYRRSPASNNIEVYLIKTDSLGNTECNMSNLSVIDSFLTCNATSSPLLVNQIPVTIDSINFILETNQNINTLCSSAGIQTESLAREEIQIFPNPANRQFTIKLNRTHSKQLELYNITGENIFSTNIIGQDSITLDCENFQPGFYYVSIYFENGEKAVFKIAIIK